MKGQRPQVNGRQYVTQIVTRKNRKPLKKTSSVNQRTNFNLKS